MDPSCCEYNLEITDSSQGYLEIETTIGADLNDVYIELDTCTRPILLSDLPDISVDKIIGLDNYISGVLDDFEIQEIDCGSP